MWLAVEAGGFGEVECGGVGDATGAGGWGGVGAVVDGEADDAAGGVLQSVEGVEVPAEGDGVEEFKAGVEGDDGAAARLQLQGAFAGVVGATRRLLSVVLTLSIISTVAFYLISCVFLF